LPCFEFTPLALAFGVIEAMANELRRIAKTRALQPGEGQQLLTLEALSAALRAVLPQQSEPEFSAAFAPFAVLFDEANIATQAGGVPAPDLMGRAVVPGGDAWRPFPIMPASIVWLAVGGIADCLKLIVHSKSAAVPGAPPSGGGEPSLREKQFIASIHLQLALAELVETCASPRLHTAFAIARNLIGDEAKAIVVEGTSLAANLASGTPH
jgi:predicted outer membrane lipoprotein